MKRYVVFIVIYLIFFFSWIGNLQTRHGTEEIENRIDDKYYWFSIYYNDRFWKVNVDGKVYDIYPIDYLNISPVVTGLILNVTEGKVDGSSMLYLPAKIPEFVFEINVESKYITTENSAIIYVTDASDIVSCLNALKIAFRYLSFGKVYLYKNGRIYVL
ncbi:MAG: hypothetical protein WBJ29_02455 [Fervidobacterium sp.]